ncbi:hypothetical protein [Fulvimonas soli]|jgi:hypothetical protein|uniref:DUF2884 family protein n=1 Tax=Fulvimonas soli TaxID=155197 RepID=A0A316I9I9_9GAMM|nr:hypothetical protein [Fulvimonas soli]PWK89897.1 hypothetical protein C7456_104255 [Fulvimonas soli]TNY25565.1 hypothetical protein BV497_13245 [Fulvimonas soli]
MKPFAFNALALALLLPLAACSQSGQTDTQPGAADAVAQASKEADKEVPPSMISGEIRKAMEAAKKELATKNIDIRHVHVNHHGKHDDDEQDPRPKAEITPQGDLLIAGKPVPATPEQHALLLDYRQQIVGIAEAGMDIGSHAADMGVDVAKEAVWGALTGKSDKEIEAAIKPQTDRIEAAAAVLCQRMPGLLSAQQKLAAAMPEFRPYATMQQKDVDDCGKKTADKDDRPEDRRN